MESGSSTNYENKFIVPGEGGESSKSEEIDGIPVKKLHLSVDPDCVEEEEGEVFVPNYADKYPSQVTEEEVLAAIHRRSYERERRERIEAEKERNAEGRGVKMSIGNWDEDEMETEDEETEEAKRRRLNYEMQRLIQQDRRNEFDLEGNSDQLAQYIRERVNDAMFSPDNAIDGDGTMFKRKGPKIIEGYMWGATIGNGSYGKVKEVIDTFTLTRRAAKIMKYDKIKKIPNGWPNIRMEMKILNLLTHRNIIKLIEVFDIPDKKKVYMIFEYCIGSVQQLLDMEPAKRLPIGESHMIFRELIHGLDYLHSRRISHKDIKPGNLLVAIDFSIKICDFGVAEEISVYQDNGICTRVNGTPKFQPPECVAGNHEFFDGYKADIWSAGVTLYNLVSGKYPFDCARLYNLYESIAKDPLVMPTNVYLAPNLIDLIQKMLVKDFNARIHTGDILIHSWFVTTFPEDESLGRVMERMRTGDRPLTMRPSMQVKYDGPTSLEELDCDEKVYTIPILTEGGEIDQDTFSGLKFIQATDNLDGTEDSSLEPMRRPSSRSTPTSAPRIADGSSSSPQQPPPRSRKKGFFSCLFRRRSNS